MGSPNNKKAVTSPFTCMHKVLHNFGDWELETRHMTRIEKSIYFDMRTLYLKTGKSFSDEMPMLYRLFSCWNDEEKTALDFILKDKFKHDKKSKTYRHREWDLIIKNYLFRHRFGLDDVTDYFDDVTPNVTNSDLQRKAKSRQELKKITDDLTALGIDLTNVKGAKALRALYEKHKSQIEVTECHSVSQKNVTENHAITSNQQPITDNQENNNTTAGEQKFFDIRNWQAPDFIDFILVLHDNEIFVQLTEDDYIAEVDKFKSYNVNQVAQGKPALADDDYRASKFIDWFKRLSERQASLQVDDDLPPIYHQPTAYHPSHAKPVVAKLDPSQCVAFNGVPKPCLPNMTQQQTWDYVMAHMDAGESSDETYDRVAGAMFGAVA